MFDHLLEQSFQDNSIKWLNLGFGGQIKEKLMIKSEFTHLIWSSGFNHTRKRKTSFIQNQRNNNPSIIQIVKQGKWTGHSEIIRKFM